ncbi:MAG: PEP-CTERM sorting domain-containing protein [Armatimonadetes bacterium]|nr:PEP-CTERM sorting domain-containing protein [Armatimonadota bacterium]MBS1712557.1 PEP-CTERM sorting domain-containing protein [Armatimonadota bacterium]MBX3109134.1 PEP-CTERM sorting domain-containing protein [Fimbriimonadaceae bacterium]
MNVYKIGALSGLATLALAANASGSYSTGFEEFTAGNIDGQGGWSINSNANHQGIVQSAVKFSGDQALEIRTQDNEATQNSFMGVIDGLRTPLIDKSGESTTINGPALNNQWTCSFWFRTPDAAIANNTSSNFEDPYGGILELNPSFSNGSSGSRYANLGLYDAALDTQNYWNGDFGYSSGLILDIYSISSPGNSFDSIAAANLSYATWYRIDMSVLFADGENGDGTNNDIFTVSVSDASNTPLGTAVGSTWEYGFRNASWGTGGPMSIDNFSVRSMRDTGNRNLGYIDDLTMESVPEPGTIALFALGATAALKRRKK